MRINTGERYAPIPHSLLEQGSGLAVKLYGWLYLMAEAKESPTNRQLANAMRVPEAMVDQALQELIRLSAVTIDHDGGLRLKASAA